MWFVWRTSVLRDFVEEEEATILLENRYFLEYTGRHGGIHKNRYCKDGRNRPYCMARVSS